MELLDLLKIIAWKYVQFAALFWGLYLVSIYVYKIGSEKYLAYRKGKVNPEEEVPSDRFILLFESLRFIDFKTKIITDIDTGKNSRQVMRYTAKDSSLSFLITIEVLSAERPDWNSYAVTMNPPLMTLNAKEQELLMIFFNHYRLLKLSENLTPIPNPQGVQK